MDVWVSVLVFDCIYALPWLTRDVVIGENESEILKMLRNDSASV